MDIDIGEILEEYGGRIFLTLGVVFVYAGILLMSSSGTWQSAVIFFLSIVFFLIGLGFHFEWFSGGISSMEKASNILICVSLMLLATSGILLLFTAIGEVYTFESSSHRGGWEIWYTTFHPYADISGQLGFVGIMLLIAGLILRLRSS